MCGRYVIVTKLKAIEKRFKAEVQKSEAEKYQANTNVSHGNLAPVITNKTPNQVQFFQFGFTPSWAKKQSYVINARAEGDHNKEDDPKYTGAKGIINKPMFRNAIRRQRCLVIADCFIEGPKKERLNKPHVVYLQGHQRPFAFAGIWDHWANPETGEIIHSFAIITTTANSLIQKIGHHRSPVILPREMEEVWLSDDISLGDSLELLKPYPAHEMNAYPISPDIKPPTANGIQLLEPIGERLNPEFDYQVYQDIKLEGMGHTTARTR